VSDHGVPVTEPVDLVLHIGSGKTGTSSIQHLLDESRPALAADGVLYPRTPGRKRHVRLGLFARSDDDLRRQVSWQRMQRDSPDAFREDFRRRLLAEIEQSGAHRVVMSDEAMYGLPDVALRRLRGLVDHIARSVRVVVYLRRQDEHLCSRYQQVVKVGEVRRLVERTEQTDFSGSYDYRARLGRWEELVSPAELVVRPFEPSHFRGGSLFADFLHAAGLAVPVPPPGQGTPDSRNESLDAESVEFLRILNLHRVEHEGARPGQIDNAAVVRRLAQASDGPTLVLPDEALDAFMATWEASNRAVARDFLEPGRAELFTAPRKTSGTTTRQHLAPERLDHFLAVTDLPEEMQAPMRRLVEREASTG
jgi:hypothetical protein